MGSKRGLEFHDQPERQTMYFGSVAAAVEADQMNRSIRLVFLVRETYEQRRDFWSARHEADAARTAATIVQEIEKEFTGIKLTGEWLRRIIHQTDGVRIDAPVVQPERGTVECTISVEPTTNFDAVYEFISHILTQQRGYEPRGASSPFTPAEEDEIERMPEEAEQELAVEETIQDASTTAQRALFRLTRRY